MSRLYPQLNDAGWLRREYLDRSHTAADLAAEIGCSESHVRKHLSQHGIKKRTTAIDPEWLRREHLDRRRSVRDIAQELGCTWRMVERALRLQGITWRRHPPPHSIGQLRDLAWLRRQLDAGRSQRDIARELGCTPQAVNNALIRAGIR